VVGPLRFFYFSETRSEPPSVQFKAGYPVKVLIESSRWLKQPLFVRGWHCGDQQPLHFWYRGGSPFDHVPVSPQGLATGGYTPLQLGPTQPTYTASGRTPLPVNYTGSVLFPRLGSYRIEVYDGHTTLGHFVDRMVAG
jgi:hypothetical protein